MTKHEQSSGQTVREILYAVYNRGRYDKEGGTPLDARDWLDADVAEERINAYIVSVLEELKGEQFDSLHVANQKDKVIYSERPEKAIYVSDLDAAIAMYKPTAREQKRIDFHKEVSSNAGRFKQESK